MNDNKAAAARAEAQRCVAVSHRKKDPKARKRYLKMARSWMLIAEHHEVLAAMDANTNEPARAGHSPR